MDANTKQAWRYIKVLHYYAKEWNKPLEDLIYTLIDSMTADNQFQDRQAFIDGINKLEKRKRITGDIQIIRRDKEYTEYKDLLDYEIILNNIKICLPVRMWFWIPFKLKAVNKEVGFTKLGEDIERLEKNSYLQFFVNIMIPIITLVFTTIEFIKS